MYTADLASCAASTSSHNFMTNKKLVKRPSVCEHCLGFCWGLGWKIAVSCTGMKPSWRPNFDLFRLQENYSLVLCGSLRRWLRDRTKTALEGLQTFFWTFQLISFQRPKLNFNTFKLDNEKALKSLYAFIDIAATDHISLEDELLPLLKNVVSQLNPNGQPRMQSSLLEVLLFFR